MSKSILSIITLFTLSLSHLPAETYEYDFPLAAHESIQDLQALWWPWDLNLNEIDLPRANGINLTNILELEKRLGQKIYGQDHAIKATADAIVRFAAGVGDPNAPIATFLYVGPTGVGKTELAKALTSELFGTDKYLHINMAEYTLEQSIQRLIGSPPGYVDSGKGGELTNYLMDHPYGLVLCDEVEKAHPKVIKLFLQLFDEGKITSAMGKTVHGRNVIYIMTSNVSAEQIINYQNQGVPLDNLLSLIEPDLMKALSPELYNRVSTIVFTGLSPKNIELIAKKLLTMLEERVFKQKGIKLRFEPSIIDYLVKTGYHPTLGARPLKRLIEKDLTTLVAKAILQGNAKKGDTLIFTYTDGVVKVDIQRL